MPRKLHSVTGPGDPYGRASSLRDTLSGVSLLPGLRVLMALYAPLLIGYAVGHVYESIPIAAGALIAALVDPGGSNERRGASIAATMLGGAAAFYLGDLAGAYPALGIGYAVIVIYVCGLFVEFGAAGIRAGSWLTALALLGLASTGVDPGIVSPAGIVLGGAWSLMLAVGPFRQRSVARKGLTRRTRHLGRALESHLALRTAVGRHAARVAIAAGTALAIAYAFDRPHVGWIAAAAVAVLDPRITRLTPRVSRLLAGTLAGATLAVVVVSFAPSTPLLLAILAVVLFGAVTIRSVEYGAYVTAFTAFSLALSAFSGAVDVALVAGKVADALLGAGLALLIARLSMPRSERERLAREIELL